MRANQSFRAAVGAASEKVQATKVESMHPDPVLIVLAAGTG